MNSCDDPRSYDYKRIYNKEPINKLRFFLIICIDFSLSVLCYFLFKKIIIVFLFNFIYYLLLLKYVLIFIVKLYQKIAPISIKSKCR